MKPLKQNSVILAFFSCVLWGDLDRKKNWNKLWGRKEKTKCSPVRSFLVPPVVPEGKEQRVLGGFPWPVTSQTRLAVIKAPPGRSVSGPNGPRTSSQPRCTGAGPVPGVQRISDIITYNRLVFSGVRNEKFKAAEVKLISASVMAEMHRCTEALRIAENVATLPSNGLCNTNVWRQFLVFRKSWPTRNCTQKMRNLGFFVCVCSLLQVKQHFYTPVCIMPLSVFFPPVHTLFSVRYNHERGSSADIKPTVSVGGSALFCWRELM